MVITRDTTETRPKAQNVGETKATVAVAVASAELVVAVTDPVQMVEVAASKTTAATVSARPRKVSRRRNSLEEGIIAENGSEEEERLQKSQVERPR